MRSRFVQIIGFLLWRVFAYFTLVAVIAGPGNSHQLFRCAEIFSTDVCYPGRWRHITDDPWLWIIVITWGLSTVLVLTERSEDNLATRKSFRVLKILRLNGGQISIALEIVWAVSVLLFLGIVLDVWNSAAHELRGVYEIDQVVIDGNPVDFRSPTVHIPRYYLDDLVIGPDGRGAATWRGLFPSHRNDTAGNPIRFYADGSGLFSGLKRRNTFASQRFEWAMFENTMVVQPHAEAYDASPFGPMADKVIYIRSSLADESIPGWKLKARLEGCLLRCCQIY